METRTFFILCLRHSLRKFLSTFLVIAACSPVKVNQYFERAYGLKMEAVFSSEERVDIHRSGRAIASLKIELFIALFLVPVFMCQITIKCSKQLDCGHQANMLAAFITLDDLMQCSLQHGGHDKRPQHQVGHFHCLHVPCYLIGNKRCHLSVKITQSQASHNRFSLHNRSLTGLVVAL